MCASCSSRSPGQGLLFQRAHRQVAVVRGDANALDLLVALHRFQAAESRDQIHEIDLRQPLPQLVVVLPGHGADQPHAPALDAALLEVRDHTRRGAGAAPLHVVDHRHALRVGQVIEELHEQRRRAFAREDQVHLARARPTRQILHFQAAAAVHDQRRRILFAQNGAHGRVPPRKLRFRKRWVQRAIRHDLSSPRSGGLGYA